MARTTTPSFITELPLQVTPKQESTLLVRLGFARQLYNACLGEALKRLSLMRQSKAYQSACYLPKDDKHIQERKGAFHKVRLAFQFDEYALHKFAGTIQIGWIGSSVVQTVASRAFKTVDRYAYGKSGKPRFKKQNQFDSLEGKQNTVISWNENAKTVTWGGLVMPVMLLKEGRKGNDVIQHGLDAPLKYVRVVRRKLNGKNRFYAQLVCEGQPLQKSKNKVGVGVVGLDNGPSTIAMVALDAQNGELKQFANELAPDQRKIRVLQRKLDRQRRANNPQNYAADGTIKQGKKEWNHSKGYEQTGVDLAEINRKLAEYRESLHGRLINHIFSMGNIIHLEKLSYRGFQKMYGRSAGKRAPGKFVSMLKRKAVSAGVSVNEFPTRTTQLSQVCLCGEVKKKPLSQRWHVCECGWSPKEICSQPSSLGAWKGINSTRT